MHGTLFVVSGPSGVGKSTIIDRVGARIDGVGYSVSHTTRKPRGTERDGVEYHFVDKAAFTRMAEDGAFIEWAPVYDEFYGTSFESLSRQTGSGLDVLLDVDTQGANNIRTRVTGSVLIFILPPSLDILRRRLESRGTDAPSTVNARMDKARETIRQCARFDYLVVNNDLEEAAAAVTSIVVSERCRTSRRIGDVASWFDMEARG